MFTTVFDQTVSPVPTVSIDDLDDATRAAIVRHADRAVAAVSARQGTRRPGGDWELDGEIPVYVGVFGTARLYASMDGRGYEVIVTSPFGREASRTTYAGLGSAFRAGADSANTPETALA